MALSGIGFGGSLRLSTSTMILVLMICCDFVGENWRTLAFEAFC